MLNRKTENFVLFWLGRKKTRELIRYLGSIKMNHCFL